MTQRLTFKIEYVNKSGFHLLSKNVKLNFPDSMGTYPMPPLNKCYDALKKQHPRIYMRIPDCGRNYKCGLHFIVKRRRKL